MKQRCEIRIKLGSLYLALVVGCFLLEFEDFCEDLPYSYLFKSNTNDIIDLYPPLQEWHFINYKTRYLISSFWRACIITSSTNVLSLSNNLSKFTSRLSTAPKLTHFYRKVFHRHLSPKYLFGSQVNHNYWRTFPRCFGCKQCFILQLLTQFCWFLCSSSSFQDSLH